jgi:hypothetical protein
MCADRASPPFDSARPSRRRYESDVYVPSRPASSFKRPHASSSYSLSSSKHSTFFADLAATPTPVRPPRLENLVERLVPRRSRLNRACILTRALVSQPAFVAGMTVPLLARRSSSNAATECATRVLSSSLPRLSPMRSTCRPNAATLTFRSSMSISCLTQASRGIGP